jgi:hypothetical protein
MNTDSPTHTVTDEQGNTYHAYSNANIANPSIQPTNAYFLIPDETQLCPSQKTTLWTSPRRKRHFPSHKAFLEMTAKDKGEDWPPDEISTETWMQNTLNTENQTNNINQNNNMPIHTKSVIQTRINEVKEFSVSHEGRDFHASVTNGQARINDYNRGNGPITKADLIDKIYAYEKNIEDIKGYIEKEKRQINLLEKIEAAARGEITL